MKNKTENNGIFNTIFASHITEVFSKHCLERLLEKKKIQYNYLKVKNNKICSI